MSFILHNAGNGRIVANYLNITNSGASYSASAGPWYAVSSTNGGGNSGWIFSAPSVALARIEYNSKWLEFPFEHYRYQDDTPRVMARNRSADGETEFLNIAVDQIISTAWRWLENASTAHQTLKRGLRSWFQWAQLGNQWSLTLDIGETVTTTTTAAILVGAKTITVANAAGIIATKTYVLRNRTKLVAVQVFSIAGNVITVVDPIDFAFASGARFRSDLFWSGRIFDAKNPIVEVPPLHYDVELDFSEDVNDL